MLAEAAYLSRRIDDRRINNITKSANFGDDCAREVRFSLLDGGGDGECIGVGCPTKDFLCMAMPFVKVYSEAIEIFNLRHALHFPLKMQHS